MKSQSSGTIATARLLDLGMHRRHLLKSLLGCGGALCAAGCVPKFAHASLVPPPHLFDWGNPGALSHRAIHLVETTNTIDMLCQVRNALVVKGQPNGMEHIAPRFMQWFDDPASIDRDELDRYFLSGIRIFHPATDPKITSTYKDPFAGAEWWLKGWQAICNTHPEWFALVLSPDDLAIDQHRGKLKIILGLQNGDHFRSAADVAHFYDLGQRVSQLTYNSENDLGGGAFAGNVGLKPLGLEVIQAMNRAGMALDLSHANTRTAVEACAAAEVTPLISHTNCEALNPGFNRAVPDVLIKAVAAKGGVIGLTVVRSFVSPNEPTTLEHYIDHIDHIAQLVGIDHVGIGNDNDLTQLDGVDDEARKKALSSTAQGSYQWRDKVEIEGLDHPRRIYDICEGLVRRGYRDADISQVLGGNWERVLKHIWTTRV